MSVAMESVKGQVFEYEGTQGGNLYSDGSGYFYRLKERRKTRWRLVCNKKRCKGKASLLNPYEDCRVLTHNGVHSCAARPLSTPVTDRHKEILDRRKAVTTTRLSR